MTETEMQQRTLDVFPGGAQTESKRWCRYVEGSYPRYIMSGHGAYINDGEKDYCDWSGSLGANLLGHGEPRVVEAVRKQLAKGNLFICPSPLETELGERLRSLIPCLEQIRFLKSGSEACGAAVRIARAYTGRTKIISIGFHGHFDIFAAASPHDKGCPQSRKDEIIVLQYNDWDSLYECFLGHKPRPGRESKDIKPCDIAAVIVEPLVLDPPKPMYLEKMRTLCDRFGVVLIWDEVVSGFRTREYTASNWLHIKPDLMCLGKAMANGLPISVVGGKKELMQTLLNGAFVSSTFGADLASMAAAMRVLDILEADHVIDHIWDVGRQLQEQFDALTQGLDKTKCIGYPCRTYLDFPSVIHRSVFWEQMIKRGVFVGYNNFPVLAHGALELTNTFTAMTEAMQLLQAHWEKPEVILKGKAAEATLRLRDR